MNVNCLTSTADAICQDFLNKGSDLSLLHRMNVFKLWHWRMLHSLSFLCSFAYCLTHSIYLRPKKNRHKLPAPPHVLIRLILNYSSLFEAVLSGCSPAEHCAQSQAVTRSEDEQPRGTVKSIADHILLII